jgi:lipopolysaccharide transport system ATP-binding protein
MSKVVLSVENVSKMYRIGLVSGKTLKQDINRWWHTVRGKEDPYLKIGEKNDRSKKAESDFVWVLNNIDFKLEQGETLGIIGRNGAGKSTLLKILSRVTKPTSGNIKVKGRIASLLEVGTGFHPELSGRENIFLNGAILGMRKKEIQAKLDEIIDFSGVERYIDTPVKRYSSGMYVRLAFAVAAHLESEILIIDEVLAVGDAEFQKKCLGKMNDATSKEGRTVLFVSHNMAAVQNLCTKGLHLQFGQTIEYGNIQSVIQNYLRQGNENLTIGKADLSDRIRSRGKILAIKSAWSESKKGEITNVFKMGESITLKFEYDIGQSIPFVLFGFGVETELGIRIATFNNDVMGPGPFASADKGIASCTIENPQFATGRFFISLAIVHNGIEWVDFIEQAITITIEPADVFNTGKLMSESQGFVYSYGKIENTPYELLS